MILRRRLARALDDLVRSGKVLYVGISDTPAWIVSRAPRSPSWISRSRDGRRWAADCSPAAVAPTANGPLIVAWPASLEFDLQTHELEALDQASRVPLGFPGEFGGASLAYGNTFELIDDYRRTIDALFQ